MEAAVNSAITVWDVAVNVALIMTPIIIGAGFWFASNQLKATHNARMAEIVMSITQRWESKDMRESRRMVHGYGDTLARRIKEEAEKPDSQELSTLVQVGNFFDSLGLLVVEGLIDCPMAYKLFGRAEEHFYNLYRPILEETRYKPYYQYFAELHQEFTKEKARCSTS